MVRSMTGFGRAEVSSVSLRVSAEARSVNHRHLDVVVRLPGSLTSFEPDARRLVQSRIERGRVEVAVQVVPAVGHPSERVTIDGSLARSYVEAARDVARELGVGGDVPLAWLLDRPGVVRLEQVEAPDDAATWRVVAEALGAALEALVARRTAEGDTLAAELRGLHGTLRATVEGVAGRIPPAAARREARLRERLRALAAEVGVDENRVTTEMAIWADKTDVTEELTRLRAHLDQFADVLDKGGPVGRVLDFLIQELNREINTIASKADDLEISQATVAAKGIIEKMREQVQNLE